tara:strand:+ start:2067 stop:2450 length:384 start_codon:yes stop_codon:yes gene_type:complete
MSKVVNVSVSLNVLIILMGIVVMILADEIHSDLSVYTLSLTIVALLSILLTLLSKRNDEVLLSVIIILLSLYQVIGGILKIIAAEKEGVIKKSEDKVKVSETLCYVMGGLSLVVGMSLFSMQVNKLQ